jgi:hypothetical protein
MVELEEAAVAAPATIDSAKSALAEPPVSDAATPTVAAVITVAL